MKTLSFIIGIMALAFTSMPTIQAKSSPSIETQDESGQEVPVISYFNKDESLTYWLCSERRQVKDGDTVLIRRSREKFSLTVLDSTRTGYRIEYKLLDYEIDTTGIDNGNGLPFEFTKRMGDKLIGKSLVFRTDECGKILSYEQEGKLKKAAWKMVKALRTEISNLPETDSLKAIGIDTDKLVAKYFDSIDIDNLVKQGLKDLEFMFALYGTVQYTGEARDYTPRSETQYETSVYINTSKDEDSGNYGIYTISNRVVPAEDAASLISAIVQDAAESMSEGEIGKEMSDAVRDIYSDDVQIRRDNYWQFFQDGWPSLVIDDIIIQSESIYREDTTIITFDSYRSGPLAQ